MTPERVREHMVLHQDEVSNLTVVRWIKTSVDGGRCAQHCQHHYFRKNGTEYCGLFNDPIVDGKRVEACVSCKRVPFKAVGCHFR